MKRTISLLLMGLMIFTACQAPIGDSPSTDLPTDEPPETPADLPNNDTESPKQYEAVLKEPLTIEQIQKLKFTDPLNQDSVQAIREFFLTSAPLLLSGNQDDNYSPLSLYMALAMVATGAQNDSAIELYDVLGREMDPDQLAADMAQIMERMNIRTTEGKIQLANSIWNQFNFPFNKEYIQRLNDQFQASLFEVDFTDPETGKQMSQWVSKMTEGLIKPTFEDTNDYISVLFNALYFKESWLVPFDASNTQPYTFKGVQGNSDKDFLQAVKQGNYINHDGIEGIILPFELSRMILLKKSGTNPIDILKDYDLDEVIAKTSIPLVDLKLPKFNFSNVYQLTPMLEKLGLEKVFDPNQADFSGISPADLFISNVVQNSYIGLDESGVEAAAVTSVIMGTTSIPTKQVELVFDEPFLFIIESYDGLPLFVGTLSE